MKRVKGQQQQIKIQTNSLITERTDLNDSIGAAVFECRTSSASSRIRTATIWCRRRSCSSTAFAGRPPVSWASSVSTSTNTTLDWLTRRWKRSSNTARYLAMDFNIPNSPDGWPVVTYWWFGCLYDEGTVPRQSELHRNAWIERSGHHHGPAADGHQPAGQFTHGPRPGTEEQRVQAPPGRHGESRWQWKRRAHPLQHEPQTAGRCSLPSIASSVQLRWTTKIILVKSSWRVIHQRFPPPRMALDS